MNSTSLRFVPTSALPPQMRRQVAALLLRVKAFKAQGTEGTLGRQLSDAGRGLLVDGIGLAEAAESGDAGAAAPPLLINFCGA